MSELMPALRMDEDQIVVTEHGRDVPMRQAGLLDDRERDRLDRRAGEDGDADPKADVIKDGGNVTRRHDHVDPGAQTSLGHDLIELQS